MLGDVTAISPRDHSSYSVVPVIHYNACFFFLFKYVLSDLIIYSFLRKRVIARAFMGPDYLGERVNVNKHGGKRSGMFQRA